MTNTDYVLFGYKLESEIEGRVWANRTCHERIDCDVLLVREGEKDWQTSFRVGGHVVLAGFGQTPQEAIKDIEPSVDSMKSAMNMLSESMEQHKRRVKVQQSKEKLGVSITTFKQILEVVEKADPYGYVIIKRGELPYEFQKEYWNGVDTYRGENAQAAIGYGERQDRALVSTVIQELKNVEEGEVFQGWKGVASSFSNYEGLIHLANRMEFTHWVVDTVELTADGSVVINGKQH